MYGKLMVTAAFGLMMFAGETVAQGSQNTIIASGTCGNDCTYTLDAGGKVIATGSGVLTELDKIDAEKVKSVEVYGIDTIRGGVFTRLKNIEEYYLADSVTTIEGAAFGYNYTSNSLKKVTMEAENVNIDKLAFYLSNVPDMDYKSVTWSCGEECKATMKKDGSAVFKGSGALTSTGVPSAFAGYSSVYIDGFSSVGGFGRNATLKEVVLSGSVTSIADEAFRGSGLEKIEIPDSVTSIGPYAFAAIQAEEIVLPDSVISIGDRAFAYNYERLKSVVIPGSVESVENLPFYETTLANLYCEENQQELCESLINKKKILLYKVKGKDILYYDYTGKLVKKGVNKNYEPKKIYTVEEAMEATKDGDKFHVFLTYK